MNKICTKCKIEKPLTGFYENKRNFDGLHYWCKKCDNEYNKNWHQENRDVSKKYYQKNGKKIREYQREYQRNNREKRNEYHRQYRQENRQKMREYKRNYRKNERNNDKVRLNDNMSGGIKQSLRSNKNGYHWESLVNFTLQDLILHLEKQFTSEMSWDNYGNFWHVDHYIPKSWFIYSTSEDLGFQMCWDLGNLQPKEGSENLSKGNRFVG